MISTGILCPKTSKQNLVKNRPDNLVVIMATHTTERFLSFISLRSFYLWLFRFFNDYNYNNNTERIKKHKYRDFNRKFLFVFWRRNPTDSFNSSHTKHLSKSVTLKHLIPPSQPLRSPCTHIRVVYWMGGAIHIQYTGDSFFCWWWGVIVWKCSDTDKQT